MSRLAVRLLGSIAALSALTACGSTVPIGEQAGSLSSAEGVGGLGSVVDGSASGTPGSGVAGSTTTAPGSASPVVGADSTPLASGSAVPSGVSSSAPGVASSIATSGPGWDAKHVYIGLPTEKDSSATFKALGISFDPGDAQADASAIIEAINARGGVLGRQIVLQAHDNSTPAIESNPDNVAQANCTYFSQDHRVAAVVDMLSAINIPACLKPAKVPALEAGTVAWDTQSYVTYGPYAWSTAFPDNDLLSVALVSRLKAQNYFQGWNTATGAAGPAPTKVGILEPNSDAGKEITRRLTSELQANGVEVASTFLYDDSATSYGNQTRAAVLKFAAAKVTHVINIPPVAAVMLFFLEAAQNQHYHPRLGLTSYTLPNQAPSDVPVSMLVGSMGIGFNPGSDMTTAQQPTPNASARACDAAIAKHGLKYTNPVAVGTARQICDAIELFVAAARAGGGFDPDSLARGIAAAGPGFQPGAVFGSHLSASNHSMPGSGRDISFSMSCKCYSYVSGLYPLPRS